jgi:dTDP-4-amino-4,6-dideoxygalactose transaminase
VIRVKEREALQTYLKEKNVPTAIYYPLGLHLQQCFSSLGYKRGDFPVTELVSQEVLALPIYPELSPDQQDHIISAVKGFYG